MHSIKSRFGALILIPFLLAGAASARANPPEAQSISEAPWRFSAILYGWLPSAPAGITIGQKEVVSLPEDLDTVLEALNFAAMGLFEAQKGPLGFYLSPVYYDGDIDRDFTGLLGRPRTITIAEEVWFIDYGVSYEIGRWDIGAEPDSGVVTLEPYAGFRFFHDRFRADVDPEPPLDKGLRLRKTVSTNSPVVGLKAEWWPSANLVFHLKGDYGGFGVQNMHKTYQVASWLAYHFKWGNLDSKVFGGYRYVKLELENDPLEVDVAVRGPLIGLGFEF